MLGKEKHVSETVALVNERRYRVYIHFFGHKNPVSGIEGGPRGKVRDVLGFAESQQTTPEFYWYW